MKTATVGEIQKNFAELLKKVKAGEEVIVTKRGEPMAKFTALGPRKTSIGRTFLKRPSKSRVSL